MIERTYWTAERILSAQGMDGRRQVETLDEAILVSSLCRSGRHAPALDLDYPVIVEPTMLSSVPYVSMFLPPERVLDGPWLWLDHRLHDFGLIDWPVSLTYHQQYRDQAVTRASFSFTVPVTLVPSSDPNHHHLYLEHELAWEDYQVLLRLLERCGFLGKGFVENSIDRGQTMLLKPGLKKEDLAARGIVLEAGSK